MTADMNVLTRAKRIVVKVGSALLVHPLSGTVNHAWLAGLAADGETVVAGVEHIERGYDDFVGTLGSLGADVAWQ